LGTVGAAIALLATDGCMTALVLRTALHYVQDSPESFVPALFVMPSFRRLLQLAPEA
jgi:hypothetical protein